MLSLPRYLTIALALLAAALPAGRAPEQSLAQAPTEWIEPETGHRVVRLSETTGSASLYFHQNGYTNSGDKLLFSTSTGLSTINLQTKKIEEVVQGRVNQVVVGRKSRRVFYNRGGVIFSTHLDTRETREITKMPAASRPGSGLAVNADETLLAGSVVDGAGDTAAEAFTRSAPSEPAHNAPQGQIPPNQESNLEMRWARRTPMHLFTINIKSGAFRELHPSTDWLNHVQFSPTDPTLIMFCHEGPWHKVDRIWTIRTDGSQLRKIHTRTMEMEIAGHEFFSQDGKTIWYDLQTPKSQVFWLAGYVLATGQRIKYRVEREHWSVHFNVSPDGKLFAGDGGGPESVAAPGNGQWIYLFTPQNGTLKAERLVNLAKHSYRLEPNVTFTPDGKRIVFRSNMHGETHVYAVDVGKSRK